MQEKSRFVANVLATETCETVSDGEEAKKLPNRLPVSEQNEQSKPREQINDLRTFETKIRIRLKERSRIQSLNFRLSRRVVQMVEASAMMRPKASSSKRLAEG